jgi:hypothetical protein
MVNTFVILPLLAGLVKAGKFDETESDYTVKLFY